ncbi:hypothetical protein OSTOST_18678 [Ostertagia ostertagi]
MDRCLIEDNFNSGIIFEGVTANSTISIWNTNFTQNRGSTISVALIRDTDVVIRGNVFTTNHLNDFGDHEAVIKIATFAETSEPKIHIMDNRFEQNAMNNVMELRHLGGKTIPVLIEKNNFVGNLARSVVDLDVPRVVVRGNYFSNSSCEITKPHPLMRDTVANYWGHEKDTDPKAMAEPLRPHRPTGLIRTTTPKAAAMAAVLKPFENTYNQVKARPLPYSVSSKWSVSQDQIVICRFRSRLAFAQALIHCPGKGKLYLNGTADRPIRLFGESTWRGLVVKPGGTLVLSHAIIEGSPAFDRLWNKILTTVQVHGVEITANAPSDVDPRQLPSLSDQKAQELVSMRGKGSIAIRNVAIRDGWGSGIDFISPAEDIRIENVSVTNGSSYSIHIVEFPLLPLKSVLLQNVSVTDQNRGHAGVLVTSGWVERIEIDQSFFTRNTVPSLIIGLECHAQKSPNSNDEHDICEQRGYSGSF